MALMELMKNNQVAGEKAVAMEKWDTRSFQLLLAVIFNRLKPRQNGRQFPDDNFKCIFLNENI